MLRIGANAGKNFGGGLGLKNVTCSFTLFIFNIFPDISRGIEPPNSPCVHQWGGMIMDINLYPPKIFYITIIL